MGGCSGKVTFVLLFFFLFFFPGSILQSGFVCLFFSFFPVLLVTLLLFMSVLICLAHYNIFCGWETGRTRQLGVYVFASFSLGIKSLRPSWNIQQIYRGQHEATGQSLASFNIYILGPSLLFLFLVILQHTARILVFVTFKPWLSVAYLGATFGELHTGLKTTNDHNNIQIYQLPMQLVYMLFVFISQDAHLTH